MTHTLHSLNDVFLHSEIPANDLIRFLEIVLALRKKYGKALYHKKNIESVANVDPWIASILRLLALHKATNSIHIKQLCKLIKQQKQPYIPQFTVCIPRENYLSPIQEKIINKFPHSNIHTQSNIDVGVEIHGEWRHYKRNLDQDIEKLLWDTN